jgi:hypothetical protein
LPSSKLVHIDFVLRDGVIEEIEKNHHHWTGIGMIGSMKVVHHQN